MALDFKAIAIADKHPVQDGLPEVLWRYPSLDAELEAALVERLALVGQTKGSFMCSKYGNSWLYTLTAQDNAREPRAFTVVLVSSTFNPEAYTAVLRLLCQIYHATGDPIPVLEAFLSLYATGGYSRPGLPAFRLSSLQDEATARTARSSLRDLVGKYGGAGATLLWSAVLQRKRLMALANSPAALLRLLRALPQLAWHRQDWAPLRPLVALLPPPPPGGCGRAAGVEGLCARARGEKVGAAAADARELSRAGVYWAGTTDPRVREMEGVFDLFVDVEAGRVVVARHAKADFAAEKFHQGIAKFLEEGHLSKDSDEDFAEALAGLTADLLSNLRGLLPEEGRGKITQGLLEGLPPSRRQFLYNVALAEGLAE